MAEWVPAGGKLDEFAELSKDNGLFVQNLAAGTTLQLEAMDGAILRLIVIDPSTKTALLNIKNSRAVDGDYRGFVQGSTFGSTLMKLGWIGAGMRLEFNVTDGRRQVIYSRIKSISVVSFAPSSGQVH